MADLEDSNIFTVITGKKQHGAPTDYGFCIKVKLRRMEDELESNKWHKRWPADSPCCRDDDNDDAVINYLFYFWSSITGSLIKVEGRWRSCGCSVPRMSKAGLVGWRPSDSLRWSFFSCATLQGWGHLFLIESVLFNQRLLVFCSTGLYCTRITRFHNKEKHCYHIFQHPWWVYLFHVIRFHN